MGRLLLICRSLQPQGQTLVRLLRLPINNPTLPIKCISSSMHKIRARCPNILIRICWAAWPVSYKILLVLKIMPLLVAVLMLRLPSLKSKLYFRCNKHPNYHYRIHCKRIHLIRLSHRSQIKIGLNKTRHPLLSTLNIKLTLFNIRV